VPASPSMSVSGEIPKHSAAQTAGSSTATLAGLGVLALLAAGVGVTAWRRTRRV
jgi:LPXTG-motif cell wall-anchored protein